MNPVHIHLALNHVAIMAAVFSVVVFAVGVVRKNQSIVRLALFGFVVAALFAIPVFLTGEDAEEAVEHAPGVTEAVIEQHEEAGETALWLVEIAGALALGALAFRSKPFFSGKVFYAAMIVVSLLASGSIAYTGFLGGKIRHTEISGTNGAGGETLSPGEGGENNAGGEAGEGKDDDDDDD